MRPVFSFRFGSGMAGTEETVGAGAGCDGDPVAAAGDDDDGTAGGGPSAVVVSESQPAARDSAAAAAIVIARALRTGEV
ncbi:hypothetical protein Q0Z83_086370 [Actinoplanes sichuanensis]|nr:hypothetical protein Q0Z83_086370 [Actinoplanes sichuanensis]